MEAHRGEQNAYQDAYQAHKANPETREEVSRVPPLSFKAGDEFPPEAFPDAYYDLGRPGFITTPLPECVFGVFNHVHKTGGTTLRRILVDQAQWGHFEFYSLTTFGWPYIIRDLVGLATNASSTLRPDQIPHRRVLIEIHGDEMYDFAHKLRELRAVAKLMGPQCKVVSFAYLREPVAHYLSFYHYFVPRVRFTMCEWDPPRALQTKILLGIASPPEKDGVLPLQAFLGGEENDLVDAGLAALDEYSFIGALELFDESLLLLADELGLQHPEYIGKINAANLAEKVVDTWAPHNSPEWRASKIAYIKKLQEEAVAIATKKKGESIGPCTKTVTRGHPRTAENDQWAEQVLDDIIEASKTDLILYKRVIEKLITRMNEGGVDFEARVHGLRAAIAGKAAAAEEHRTLYKDVMATETCVRCGFDGRVFYRGCWGRFGALLMGEMTVLKCERVWDPMFGAFQELSPSLIDRKREQLPLRPLCSSTCWTVLDPTRFGGHASLTPDAIASIGMNPGDTACTRPCAAEPEWFQKETSLEWLARWDTMVNVLAPLDEQPKGLTRVSASVHAPGPPLRDRLNVAMSTSGREKKQYDSLVNSVSKRLTPLTPLDTPVPSLEDLGVPPGSEVGVLGVSSEKNAAKTCRVGMYIRIPGVEDGLIRDALMTWAREGKIELYSTLSTTWEAVVHELVGNFEYDGKSKTYVPPGGSQDGIRHQSIVIEVSNWPKAEWYSRYSDVGALRALLSPYCEFSSFTFVQNPIDAALNGWKIQGGSPSQGAMWGTDIQTSGLLSKARFDQILGEQLDMFVRRGRTFLLHRVLEQGLDFLGVVEEAEASLVVLANKLGLDLPDLVLPQSGVEELAEQRELAGELHNLGVALVADLAGNDPLLLKEVSANVMLTQLKDTLGKHFDGNHGGVKTRLEDRVEAVTGQRSTFDTVNDASWNDWIVYCKALLRLKHRVEEDRELAADVPGFQQRITELASVSKVVTLPGSRVPVRENELDECVHCEDQIPLMNRGCWWGGDPSIPHVSYENAAVWTTQDQKGGTCVRYWTQSGADSFVPQPFGQAPASAERGIPSLTTLTFGPGIPMACFHTCFVRDGGKGVECSRPCDVEREEFLSEGLMEFSYRWQGIVDIISPIM